MRYMLLIYSDETGLDQVTEAEWAATMEAYNAFTKEAQESGLMQSGEALHPTRAATTLRIQDGETLVTDGPFAETKEALGGYYIFNVPNLDEALKWAAKIPGARFGSIEVRPVMEFE
jgi:hypothetical protein